ncbi:hypothetical protein ACLOJK_041664 [Asimina triloba]
MEEICCPLNAPTPSPHWETIEEESRQQRVTHAHHSALLPNDFQQYFKEKPAATICGIRHCSSALCFSCSFSTFGTDERSRYNPGEGQKHKKETWLNLIMFAGVPMDTSFTVEKAGLWHFHWMKIRLATQIIGLKEVLVGMKVGGKRRALIPPNVGYVTESLQPIPDEFGPRRSLLSHMNEPLVFEVQLLKVL